MHNHQVHFIEDSAWPGGVDWFLANQGDEKHHFFIRDGACLTAVLSEAWVAFHQTHPAKAIPAQRLG